MFLKHVSTDSKGGHRRKRYANARRAGSGPHTCCAVLCAELAPNPIGKASHKICYSVGRNRGTVAAGCREPSRCIRRPPTTPGPLSAAPVIMPTSTAPPAWCLPPASATLASPATSTTSSLSNAVAHHHNPRRRPRPRIVAAAAPPAPPSDEDPGRSLPVDPALPSPQFGLLTDSVLEVKWKTEEEATADLPPSCVCADVEADAHAEDLSASDPYQAFAQFTRIAAPTAALGREDLASPLVGTVPQPLRSPDLQYSAASIAYRLMRYSYARKNLAEFLELFLGEFDNYEQVRMERCADMFPRDGGGHEHIHCSIVQLSPDLLFARYYFNGDPSHVFRSRVYKLKVSDDCTRGIVEMRIFRFYEETERKLKAESYDVNAIEWGDGDVYDWLEGCEVYWERYEPEEHAQDDASKRLGIEPGRRFVGYMKGGGCELYSRELGGRIRVMDDLLLTKEDLWVADRGFDEHDNFVYGNRRGVPYKMKRVHSDSQAAWTLSASQPPPDGYVP